MAWLSPQWTLLFGIFLSLFFQNSDIQNKAKTWSSKILQISIILLGASLNFKDVINQGGSGLLVTFCSIAGVFLLGFLGMKILKVQREQGILITMGTAICGGSAIGALAPVIRADNVAFTVSISIVFLLNSLAIFIFPYTGHFFELTQEQFGMWSALAIHDTSSVVAASALYGAKALEVGTTVKLVRALWIIPITLLFSLYSNRDGKSKISIPWFIFGFLLMSMAFTFFDIPSEIKSFSSTAAKLGFATTLFFVGLSLNLDKIKKVGKNPFILGVTLWVIVTTLSLVFVKTL